MAKLPSKKQDVTVSTVEIEGKKINISQFTGTEEKILLTARLKKDNDSLINAVLDIVSSCTGLDSRELPMGAVEYLFTEIRTVSVSDTLNFSIACSKCGESHPIRIKAKQLTVPEKFADELVLDTEYEGSPVKIVLKTPTAGALMNRDTKSESSELKLIMDCISEIYLGSELVDEPFTFEEFEPFFMSLKGVYIKALAFVLEYPKVTYKNKFKCIKCGEENVVDVKDTKDFFSS
uniref:Baseplate hub n=1 Tax=Ochrobactrum phage ORM_20 TaxID=2985243 RepID=A0A9N6WUT2_9VIRU|nr:baseplate hub [Ochrobactrum phage ORM_20]